MKKNNKQALLNEALYHTFIINLDGRCDRWDKMVSQMNKQGIERYERFSAIRPRLVDPLHKRVADDLYQFFINLGQVLSYQMEKNVIGTLGCLLSHIEVIKIAKSRGYPHVLILEDDAMFVSYAAKVIRRIAPFIKNDDWGMVFLGGKCSKGYVESKVNRTIKRIEGVKLAHAYLINHTLYDEIIHSASEYGQPIDWFYANFIQKKYPCFMTHPKVAYQFSGYSDIAATYLKKRRKSREKFTHFLYSIGLKL